MSYQLSEAAVVNVFELLKRNVGGTRILFASSGTRVYHPSIKEVYDDLVEYFHFTDPNDKTALLFLLTKARTRGMEHVEYYNFSQMLKRPCPKVPPSDEKPFLPYLSFLCEPGKAPHPRQDTGDGVKRYIPGREEYPSIVPPIPKGVAPPPPSKREASVELRVALSRYGPRVTLVQLVRALHEVDPYVDPQRVREIFDMASTGIDVKKTERPLADAEIILREMAPHLTMHRQKSHSSELVRETMQWPMQCCSAAMLVPPTEATVPRGSKAILSPRTHRATRASELLATYTQSMQQDPTSPRFKGQYNPIPSPRRIHVPSSAQYIIRQEAVAKAQASEASPA